MPKLGRREYYPWYDGSSASLPKDRSLNVDFLRSERRRIEHAKEWNQEYRKAERGEKLEEYVTYVIPVEISKILRRNVNGRGYNIMGTSALRNSTQLQKLALFPKDLKLPADYSLIRIEDPVKEIVLFEGDVYGTDAIVVTDFETLPIDYIYHGLGSDNVDLFDLLSDSLGGDDLMAHSVHAPMISSPGTGTDFGGIGSCSLTPTTRFGDTLNKQIARMLPPEYTNYGPPGRDTKRFRERHSKGRGRKIVYKTAEKIPDAQTRVGLKNGTSYRNVEKQAKIRTRYRGEYSYLGNIAPSGGRELHVVQDALDYFTQNEITISSYDELRMADVDLTRLENRITDYEDIWVNVVDARQVMPDAGNQRVNREAWISDLQEDWEHYLPQMGYGEVTRHISELRAEETFENILRLAQQFARGEAREQISDEDLKNARWNFKAQAERLLDSDVVKDAAREIERSHTTDRESIVHTFLKSRPCHRKELVSRLLDTKQFDNENRTDSFIQRLIDRGYIYKSPDGKLHPA